MWSWRRRRRRRRRRTWNLSQGSIPWIWLRL